MNQSPGHLIGVLGLASALIAGGFVPMLVATGEFDLITPPNSGELAVQTQENG
jgi:hypothetical protein